MGKAPRLYTAAPGNSVPSSDVAIRAVAALTPQKRAKCQVLVLVPWILIGDILLLGNRWRTQHVERHAWEQRLQCRELAAVLDIRSLALLAHLRELLHGRQVLHTLLADEVLADELHLVLEQLGKVLGLLQAHRRDIRHAMQCEPQGIVGSQRQPFFRALRVHGRVKPFRPRLDDQLGLQGTNEIAGSVALGVGGEPTDVISVAMRRHDGVQLRTDHGGDVFGDRLHQVVAGVRRLLRAPEVDEHVAIACGPLVVERQQEAITKANAVAPERQFVRWSYRHEFRSFRNAGCSGRMPLRCSRANRSAPKRG